MFGTNFITSEPEMILHCLKHIQHARSRGFSKFGRLTAVNTCSA